MGARGAGDAPPISQHLVAQRAFRETHHVAGRPCGWLKRRIRRLRLSKAQLATCIRSRTSGRGRRRALGLDRSAESRDAQGGTSLRAQKEQIAALSAWLARTENDAVAGRRDS